MVARDTRGKVVAYTRVSTQQQGRSGLGLDAQRQAIKDFVKQRNARVIETFTEIESGKHSDRPELKKALHLAKVTASTLVIAKLDRLSRNAAFLLTLRDSGVKFNAVDIPDASNTTVGILAVVAQAEREAISKRTKEALAAAKARGMKLGNPNGAAPLRRAGKGNVDALKAIQAKTAARTKDLRPVIESLREQGHVTLGALADELNSRGSVTPRGGAWYRSSVRNLMGRL
jgi:DNA invertase Pin-like site-specific DNA recombinase